jgi:hypothetical protein
MKIKMRVYVNIASGQKLVTIPKCCDIQPGQYVYLEEVIPTG